MPSISALLARFVECLSDDEIDEAIALLRRRKVRLT
jgi:hypothetical protein